MQAPFSAAEIDRTWLGTVLAERGVIDRMGALASVVVAPTAKAGLTSSTSRLELTYEHAGDLGPRWLIAKFPSSDPAWRERTNQARIFEREARFYTEIRPRCPLRTPLCYVDLVDYPNDRCVLLLEDLSDMTPMEETEGLAPHEAVAVLRSLARFHAAFWQDERLAVTDWLLPIEPPGARQFRSSLDRARLTFAGAFTKRGLRIAERFGDDPAGLYRSLRSAPATLVHNDFRPDNLFVDHDGEIAVIDFQACAFSSPAIDLALFITLSLDIEQRRALEDELLESYSTELAAQGIDYAPARVRSDYRAGVLYLLPRIVIPAGAAADPSDARLFHVLTSMIERAQQAMVDHECQELLAADHLHGRS